MSTPGPIVLLGDSRLLFTNALQDPIAKALAPTPLASARAVYLGAANGDDTQHFKLFAAAMQAIGIKHARHVTPAKPTPASLDEANLIFLAGGEALLGLRQLRGSGLLSRVVARQRAGAILIGSSAGAILLGTRVWDGTDPATLVEGPAIVPFAMDAHAAPEWVGMKALAAREPGLRMLGLQGGGGIWMRGDELVPIGAGYVEWVAGAMLERLP